MNLLQLLEKCTDDKSLAFPLLHIKLTAATSKKVATATIELPRNLVGNDLRDLRKWVCMVVAIDKDEYDRIFDEEGGKDDQD